MTTAQILQGALEMLQDKGWTKFSFSRTRGEGPYCILGAVHRVPRSSYPVIRSERNSVYEAIQDVIGRDDILVWNDEPETTYEDVVLVLKQAIYNETLKEETNVFRE